MKMCVIGLGKHKQALAIHRYGVYGLRELIPPTARQVLKYGNIILGIGIVENAYDETAVIRALRPEELEQEEMKLVDFNRKNMPGIPVEKIDLLNVDEMVRMSVARVWIQTLLEDLGSRVHLSLRSLWLPILL
jgi:hypothetical protein